MRGRGEGDKRKNVANLTGLLGTIDGLVQELKDVGEEEGEEKKERREKGIRCGVVGGEMGKREREGEREKEREGGGGEGGRETLPQENSDPQRHSDLIRWSIFRGERRFLAGG